MADTQKIADTPASEHTDIVKLFDVFKFPGVDMQALAESRRKDWEALSLANQQAYSGMQALVERRDQILKDSLAQWQQAIQGGAAPDALGKAGEGAQQALAQLRALGDLEEAARRTAWKTVQDRMQEHIAELHKMLDRK